MLGVLAVVAATGVFLPAFALSAPDTGRQSRWWFNLHSSAYTHQAVELVKSHRASITGVWSYAGLGLGDDGQLTCDDTRLAPLIKPLTDLGVTVGVALGVAQKAVESGAALRGASAAAACAARHNLTSLMIDYEPRTNITDAHAQAYARFVAELSKETHRVGVETAMCISSWSILTKFGLYAATGVDSMMSMASTYFGKNVASNQEWVSKELAQNVSLSQLAVGIGTMTVDPASEKWDYQWTETKLRSFVSWLQTRDVQNIDVWRADIDTLNGTTAEYYYHVLAEFLSGTPVPTSTTTPGPSGAWCQEGLRDGKYCCALECTRCGGPGCNIRPGGSANCCDSTFGNRTCTGPSDVACVCPTADCSVADLLV